MVDVSLRNELQDRYLATAGLVHMTGIQALARLPIDVRRADRAAGHNSAVFISGYEGSPLGGYDLELTKHLELLGEHQVVFQPAVNEELAATAVQGTQLASTMQDKRVEGVTGFWYGKAPGLDRACDALRHANLGGTHPSGGAVAFVGDDPTAKSSTVPSASEFLLADLGIPTLYPSNSQEVLDFGIHAVAMSRVSGLWAALKIVTNVADGSGIVRVDADRISCIMPTYEVDGDPYVHVLSAKLLGPSLMGLERSRNGARLELARRYAALNGLNEVVRSSPNDRIGIIAAGKTFADVRQALGILGLDDERLAQGIRLLRLGMLYPTDSKMLLDFAAGLREVIVLEDKRPFIEGALKNALFGRSGMPAVTGKCTPDGNGLLQSEGELTPDSIAVAIASRLRDDPQFPTAKTWLETARQPRRRIELPLTRPPYFCSGCPHNSSAKAPAGSLVGGGIGCHGMAFMMEPELFGEIPGFTQMGGEGAQWIGMAPFVESSHMFQNLGDGTFAHSGSLAIRAAVAAGVHITYKLLYNSAVAMTGGQHAVGQMTVPQITHELAAEGIAKIIVTTEDPRSYRGSGLSRGTEVWHRDRLIEAQETLAKIQGVTVLIHDQECATELRRKRKRGLAPDPVQRVMINERVCEGCGDCGTQSNCLSVQPVATEFGRKTKIDQSSCNKDYSCLKGDCPSFITVTPGTGKRARRIVPPIDVDSIASPIKAELVGHHTTRLLGVGGSGVVTLSQILSAAAVKDGLSVLSLDQTGMAQKGGAVVSDIKVSSEPFGGSNKAAEGEVDLYIGADLLVAADPLNLMATEPTRTVAVVSISEVPTGDMVTNKSLEFPDIQLLTGAIREGTLTDRDVFFDARKLSETYFGDDQFANVLLAGAAYQAGALPLTAESVEHAIALNGVRVDENIQAFRRGRQLVAEPREFARWLDSDAEDRRGVVSSSTDVQTVMSLVRAEQGSTLDLLIGIRIPDLIAYKDTKYAKSYAEFVERVRRVERERTPGSTSLSEAVARYLYKLMAYKDEYEVARLSLDPSIQEDAVARFGAGAKVSYRLHPPLLRAAGMHRKLTFGPWVKPLFKVLRSMRRVRGTRLDAFGYTKIRRLERRLISEYREVVEELLEVLGPTNAELATSIAELPDAVRGYEEIKLGNVDEYRRNLAALRSELVETYSNESV